MTLRTRLIAILAALVGLGLLISGIVTYGALRTFLFKRVDEQLLALRPIAVQELISSMRGTPDFRERPFSLPTELYVELQAPGGETLRGVAFGSHLPDLPNEVATNAGREPITVGSTTDPSYKFRVLTTQSGPGGRLIVAIPLAEAQDTLQRLLAIEIVVAVLLMAAIGTAAWLLIRRELHPLDNMATAATEIAAGDLTRRIEDSDPRTEVGRLGGALNVMLEQIEEAFAERSASEERMRRFLADASHELRTPLTSIRGYAELFRRGADQRPDDLRLSMRRIEEEAARMGVLVEELLMLAHVDSTRPLERGPVDLVVLAEDAAADARAQDPQRSITVQATSDAIVLGDEGRLRQAIGNLMTNALTHTPAGTSIGLEVARDGSWASLVVTDEGPGLDQETLEHAFDRFWRGDSSRSRESGGAGLGLAIVHAIAVAHGGKVTAENLESGGARFELRIPLADSQSAISDVISGRGCRLLIETGHASMRKEQR